MGEGIHYQIHREWKTFIKNATYKELFEKLVYFGVDGYYEDAWKDVLRELSKRLGVDFKSLGIGD